MLQPESLAQLARNGNSTAVDEEWMLLVESTELSPVQFAGYHSVLSELSKSGRQPQAESLAGTAIEALVGRTSASEALAAAAPFLQAVGESKELRGQVAELYRKAFADVPELEALISHAGLMGGRPARRAVRTLDVALSVQDGDYLRARDEAEVARLVSVDRSGWQFTVETVDGEETLDALALADRYARTSDKDLLVLRRFAPEELDRMLQDEVAELLCGICVQHGNRIDSSQLESMLVPSILDEGAWSGWWSRTRTALRKNLKFTLEGRSPVVITYVDRPESSEDRTRRDFDHHRDPLDKIELLERYVRDCKAQKSTPDTELYKHAFDVFRKRAEHLVADGASGAALWATAARRVGDWLSTDEAVELARRCFAQATHPERILAEMSNDALLRCALDSWAEAKPGEWKAHLLTMLPTLPTRVCDVAALRLISAGCREADFDPVVQAILASPVEHFDALLWLWDGPSKGEIVCRLSPVTVLMRVIRVLEDCRRADHLGKDVVKRVQARAKSVMGARRCERFAECLELVDAGMAAALRTHLQRLDSVGRAVRDDLLRLLRAKFPSAGTAPAVPPWVRDDVLYVTAEGLGRKQREIEHHVNVKMRDNARAIGAAAELGDLSENSEYKFALEERDLLQARLAQMNAEVAMARVMSVDDVPVDHVGIGTRVVFVRQSDGMRYEMTFVGPWEADATHGWYNYKAPMSQRVLGKRVGDSIDFDLSELSGTFDIAELHNGLRDIAGESHAETESASAAMN